MNTVVNSISSPSSIAARRTRLAVIAGLGAALLALGGSLAAGATPAHAADAAPPTVDRISGADRYEAAVNISEESQPAGNGIVFLATGQNYPDALSAASAAVHIGKAPLLLTPSNALPSVVATELKRLNPDLVVVVGGPNSVSENVVAQVKALPSPRPAGIQVTRISGSDRYEASRNLVTYAFSVGDQGKFTWVATGTNFPDALSAGAAAGASEEPVLLVDGPKPKLDRVTEGFISLRDEQAPDGVKIAGGPASVSAGIQAQIETINPVTRLDGPDRYAASVAINHASFTASPRVFLATGKNFPDALAGAAYAGAVKAPLFVVPGDCVPSQVLIEIAELGATRVTLLGGEASLSPAVAALTPCEAPE